jgi:tetratricopeptide (TPR) repeat protein
MLPLTLALSALAAGAQEAPAACGPLRQEGQYGPFDYRTDRDKLKVVEQFHFTPQVETLIKGQSGPIGGDLDYTLRAFPNHHRALLATIRLGKREQTPQPHGMQYSVECWLIRAVRFREDDTTARMIYARFLAQAGRKAEAHEQLKSVEKVAQANPFTHYNLGLIYFEMQDYDAALREAKLARDLGFPHTDLRDELVKAGRWVDDAPSAPAASAPASSASGPVRP